MPKDGRSIERLVILLGVAGILLLLGIIAVGASQSQADQSALLPGHSSPLAEAEHRVQLSMARAAWWQVFVGITGLMGLGATVVFAALAWRAAQRGADAAFSAVAAANRSAKAAEEALELAHQTSALELRAYISIEHIETGAHATPERVTFSVTVGLRNCGQTPARNVARIIEIIPNEGHTLANPAFHGFSGSRAPLDIAPGQSFTHEYSVWSDYTPTESGFQPGFIVRGRVEYYDLMREKRVLEYSQAFGEFTAPFAPHLTQARGRLSDPVPGELRQAELDALK